MTSTYEQLTVLETQNAIAADILTRLEDRGITSKGWTEADVRRGIVEVIADVRESEEIKRKDIIDSGFLDKAVGPLLDLLGVGFFDEERLPPTTTTIQLDIVDSVGQGPYDVPVGAIAVIGADTDAPLYYRLTSTVAVPQDGIKPGQFQAVAAGAKYNQLASVPVKLSTPIPGVELVATYVPTLFGIVVSAGSDAESDFSYRERLRDKWSTISSGWTAGAIRFWIRKVLPNASRIFVRDDAPATGEAWAYCAGPVSPITGAEAVAAAAYLNSVERKPVGNRPVKVLPAVSVVVPLAITLATDGSTTALSLAAGRLADSTANYTDRVFPIARVTDALYDPSTGVFNAKVSPTDDVELGPEQVVVLQPTYTIEPF